MATIAADAIATMGTIETTVKIDTTETADTIVNELQKITNLGIV